MLDTKKIESEEEYKRILKRIEVIFDAKPGTPEGVELEYLVKQVEEYEEVHYPIKSI